MQEIDKSLVHWIWGYLKSSLQKQAIAAIFMPRQKARPIFTGMGTSSRNEK